MPMRIWEEEGRDPRRKRTRQMTCAPAHISHSNSIAYLLFFKGRTNKNGRYGQTDQTDTRNDSRTVRSRLLSSYIANLLYSFPFSILFSCFGFLRISISQPIFFFGGAAFSDRASTGKRENANPNAT